MSCSCCPTHIPLPVRIVACLLSLSGFGLVIAAYINPSWAEFRHNGRMGYLGLREMCEREADGGVDCRDIEGKDILFYIFEGSFTIGVVAYGLFVINILMTFCSCCIKSTRAVGITKFFVIINDMVTFNCLMIAIATGLKTQFLGNVNISEGCILCCIAFGIAVVVCPVYILDTKTATDEHKKNIKYAKFEDSCTTDTDGKMDGIRQRKPCSIEDTTGDYGSVGKANPWTTDVLAVELKNNPTIESTHI